MKRMAFLETEIDSVWLTLQKHVENISGWAFLKRGGRGGGREGGGCFHSNHSELF